jgi:hypothetical protein
MLDVRHVMPRTKTARSDKIGEARAASEMIRVIRREMRGYGRSGFQSMSS